MIIFVGYRVKSQQGTQFRICATQRLKEYIIKGFAKALQNKIEEDTGIKFGFLHKHSFARIEVNTEQGKARYLDEEKSVQLYNFFVEKGYIKEEIVNRKTKEVAAKVQEKLKKDFDKSNERFIFAR